MAASSSAAAAMIVTTKTAAARRRPRPPPPVRVPAAIGIPPVSRRHARSLVARGRPAGSDETMVAARRRDCQVRGGRAELKPARHQRLTLRRLAG